MAKKKENAKKAVKQAKSAIKNAVKSSTKSAAKKSAPTKAKVKEEKLNKKPIAAKVPLAKFTDDDDDGFDIVTSTTHKTLRGPRGGLILCRKEFATAIDKAVFPGLQGGPHMNNVAAKAVAFGEALDLEFKTYAKQILANAKAMAEEFSKQGISMITGGTSNHLLLIDTVSNFNISGKQAQDLLDGVGITVNKNVLPDDPRGPLDPSGIRLGTPAITTRGAKEDEMKQVATWIIQVLSSPEDLDLHNKIKLEVKDFSLQFSIPGID